MLMTNLHSVGTVPWEIANGTQNSKTQQVLTIKHALQLVFLGKLKLDKT